MESFCAAKQSVQDKHSAYYVPSVQIEQNAVCHHAAVLWLWRVRENHQPLACKLSHATTSNHFVSLTIGRILSGILATRILTNKLLRMGTQVALIGFSLFILPLGKIYLLAALVFMGIGLAPIYPCNVYMTPERFGAEQSQTIIGIEMSCCFAGKLVMPVLFGGIVSISTIALLPMYLMITFLGIALMHRKLKAAF